jgi:hypothetical protein
VGDVSGDRIFLLLLGAASVGIALNRARHEPPGNIVLAMLAGLALAAALGLAIAWAGLDLWRLWVLLSGAIVIGGLATAAVAVRAIRRPRTARLGTERDPSPPTSRSDRPGP